MSLSVDIAARRVAVLRDWNANRITYAVALRALVQECGMAVEVAARILAGDREARS